MSYATLRTVSQVIKAWRRESSLEEVRGQKGKEGHRVV